MGSFFLALIVISAGLNLGMVLVHYGISEYIFDFIVGQSGVIVETNSPEVFMATMALSVALSIGLAGAITLLIFSFNNREEISESEKNVSENDKPLFTKKIILGNLFWIFVLFVLFLPVWEGTENLIPIFNEMFHVESINSAFLTLIAAFGIFTIRSFIVLMFFSMLKSAYEWLLDRFDHPA